MSAPRITAPCDSISLQRREDDYIGSSWRESFPFCAETNNEVGKNKIGNDRSITCNLVRFHDELHASSREEKPRRNLTIAIKGSIYGVPETSRLTFSPPNNENRSRFLREDKKRSFNVCLVPIQLILGKGDSICYRRVCVFTRDKRDSILSPVVRKSQTAKLFSAGWKFLALAIFPKFVRFPAVHFKWWMKY